MKEKDIKRFNRVELLEMLLEQSKEVERLKAKNHELEEQLESRRILIDQAGSIAEAALQLNQIFETAQRAADQYLENVRQICQQQAGENDRNDRKKEETDIEDPGNRTIGNRT